MSSFVGALVGGMLGAAVPGTLGHLLRRRAAKAAAEKFRRGLATRPPVTGAS